jgi:hypothetical protein
MGLRDRLGIPRVVGLGVLVEDREDPAIKLGNVLGDRCSVNRVKVCTESGLAERAAGS